VVGQPGPATVAGRIVDFEEIGRIPAPGDNVAIASKNLEAGTKFRLRGQVYALQSSLLEGQRFATELIAKGDALLSWGLPFGWALDPIAPGEYLCNAGILAALNLRQLDFRLPEQPNFRDHIEEFHLDERAFTPGRQVPMYSQPGTFSGFARTGGRGVGTRNNIIVLGTSSLTGSFAHQLERRLKAEGKRHANIDGIVAVTHTEGASGIQPNNFDLLLRTLAGFMVNPNVGAVLAVDYGYETVNNRLLEEYLNRHGYPLDHVLHGFYSLSTGFNAGLDEAERIVRAWIPQVGEMARSQQPLSELRIGLQCGGSDAFSGVSGNPLAGWVAKELIRHGGSASLAETDELIGAEPYILANTRDLATARQFLEKITIFKQRVGWHGHSAEGNPSGGNKFRGLYNIALKSIGAARKKDPEVRLDYVTGYSERMTAPGFYFMDSPGNDLESIAGQVAAGCNMIFFTTGNGSITNFPFVPTIKFVTTTGRWNLLSNDMDVNAGRYQDGMPMDELGLETFSYTVDVASGKPSVGERAGHSQVSIWRDWRQTDGSQLSALAARPVPDGKPIAIHPCEPLHGSFRALPSRGGFAADQVGLILPTSLCSGQIASRIAARLNDGELVSGRGVSRFVALPHTEGCGASSGENEDHFTRTMVGHLLHPFTRQALLLEHGCERTHNDLMRHVLEQSGVDPGRFGYASIQLDGGIDKVTARVEQWFDRALQADAAPARQAVGLEAMSLGILAAGMVSPAMSHALVRIISSIVASGGTVVIAANASLLQLPSFLAALGWAVAPASSLEYGQFARQPGLHIMSSPTGHWVETVTGLGGTGVQLMLAHIEQAPAQGHPMIPLVQIASMTSGSAGSPGIERFRPDLDLVLGSEAEDGRSIADQLLQLLCATASGEYQPRSNRLGNSDFQLTRGLLGVSL